MLGCCAEPHVVDIRSVALLRILLSLYVVVDIFFRLYLGKVSLAWYTSSSDGYYPSIVAPNDSPHGSSFHKIWFYRGSERFQLCSFAVTVLLALCFGLGCFGNNSTSMIVRALLWMTVTAVQNRAPLLNDGSDRFLRCILLWTIFIPMNQHWCISSYYWRQNWNWEASKDDSDKNCRKPFHTNDPAAKTTKLRLRSLRPRSSLSCSSTLTSNENESTQWMKKSFSISEEQPHMTIESTAVLGLTLQIALMYLGTVWNRLSGTMWLPPSLEAVYYALRSTFATKPWASNLFASRHIFYKAMTLQAMCIETFCPLLCILLPCRGKSWRHLPAMIIFFLHLGLFIFMRLPQWQCLGMICTVIWIPTRAWDELTRKATISVKHSSHMKRNIITPKHAQRKHLLKEKSWNLIIYALLIYMIYNWCGERGWISKHDNGDIGEAIQFSQHWVMYGPDPPVTCYAYAITGQIERQNQTQQGGNYSYIDLLASLKSSNIELMNRDSHYAPDNMSQRFPSWRWENAFNKISDQRDGGGIYGIEGRFKRMLQFLCYVGKRQIGQSKIPSENRYQLLSVEIRIQRLRILPPGSKERFLKESQTSLREQCH